MATGTSPLRYPGGKQVLSSVLAYLIRLNGSQEGIYAEPFAGGAGAALSLLFGEHVHRIMINDADPAIAAFWRAVVYQAPGFIKLLKSVPLTVEEWNRQRGIYFAPHRHSALRVGFATFYLNRCNRSGIIASGGPIGGKEQKGTWKIDARFNREELAQRVQRISMYRDRIELYNLDAIDFLKLHVSTMRAHRPVFAYLDPPYFSKGEHLYLNYYNASDHARLARYLKGSKASFQWVLSYDNAQEIKDLYAPLRTVRFDLSYSARERRTGKEILILKNAMVFPSNWVTRIPKSAIGMTARII
jgi:DNA adenine methylase